MTQLTTTNGDDGKPRQFVISAISVAEIWRKTENGIARMIVEALEAENVDFVAFDSDIAEFINDKYHTMLSKPELNAIARQHSWPENNLVLAREWLLKDIMILGTAQQTNCNVLITLDKNTMIPYCEQAEMNYAYAHPNCFNQNEHAIHYHIKENISQLVQE